MPITRVASTENIDYRLDGTFVATKPTGTVQNDVMITFLMNYDAAPISAPSGWTQIALVDNTAVSLRLYAYYKVAGASEPSSYSWGLDPGLDLAAGVVIQTFRGVDTSSPIGGSVTAQHATNEALASGSLNVTTSTAWLVAGDCCRHTGTTDCTVTPGSPMVDRHDDSANDTASNFTRALAVSDSNGPVASGSKNITFTRTGTTAGHNIILLWLREGTVFVNQGDTGSGTETQSIAATRSGSDTGTGTETHTIAATRSGTDTGTGTEGTPRVGITGVDTGTAAEAGSLSATRPGSDTGTATEGTPSIRTTGTGDTGTATDSQSVSGRPPGADTGSGSETGSVTASLTSGDTATWVDVESIYEVDETPDGSDGISGDETWSIVVHVSDVDFVVATEAEGADIPPIPVTPGDFGNTLVMGPGAIYIGALGALEPAVGSVGSAPDPLVWTDLGGTLGGVELAVDQEFKTVIFEQLPDTPFNRLQKRYLSIKTPLAEATLANLGLALNDSAGVTGTEYTPSVYDSATPLVYRSLIVDGWAPGVTAFGRHKRRRIIVRKCLSVDNISLSYTKDGQTIYNVTWSCHHVDGSTAPFRVIDEA